MCILLAADFHGRYHSQECAQRVDGEPARRRGHASAAEIRDGQGDQPGHPGGELDQTGTPHLRVVGELGQGQFQTVEWMGRISDFNGR
jgi:hypothetical protein